MSNEFQHGPLKEEQMIAHWPWATAMLADMQAFLPAGLDTEELSLDGLYMQSQLSTGLIDHLLRIGYVKVTDHDGNKWFASKQDAKCGVAFFQDPHESEVDIWWFYCHHTETPA
jgi:hypothetical protein